MRAATITLQGIIAGRPTLFDELVIPAQLDKDLCIARIIMRSNNMEPIYPDGPYFQAAIGWWSKSRLDVWERLEATRHYDYTPIHNYDRHELEKIVEDGTYKDNKTTDHSHTTDSTGHEGYTGNMSSADTQDDTQTVKVGGFNTSDSNAPYDKTTLDSDKTHKQDESSAADRTGQEKQTAQDVEDATRKEDWTNDRDLYAYGNIGVTSTQELIEQQREIELYNLYDIIADEFCAEFMIQVY